MERRILNIAIKHWNERFTGISAFDIAEKLKITNAEAMTLMEGLCEKGSGTINANVTLYEISLKFNKKTKKAESSDPVPVVTHIFFPSKTILERHHKRNLEKYFRDGEYKNRLRLGYSQIALVYFNINVLGKYLDKKGYYDLNDDVTGGVIRIHSEVVNRMTQDEYDEIGFDKVWYGKRKLKNGEILISAILNDLSNLPFKEQSYWHSFEVENPKFAEVDPDFDKFVSRAYDGQWVESNDPIANICKAIEIINSLLLKPVFIRTSNPYLEYPTNNTFKSFVDASSELYKIVGPDNLSLRNLKNVYLECFGGSNLDLINKESNREKSSLQILQLIISRLDGETAKRFKQHWQELKEFRVEGDHKITQPKNVQENYINNFRLLCEAIFQVLASIGNSLRQHKGA